MALRVAIVGTVEMSVRQAELADIIITALLDYYIAAYGRQNLCMVSGGAEGIDSAAEEIAEQLRIMTEIFRPKHQRWEPEGYKDRNIRVAEKADILYSIRSVDSKTYGSGWTADLAESLGKEVYRIYI